MRLSRILATTQLQAVLVLTFGVSASCSEESARRLIVAADGSGEFSSIQAAIDAATNATRERPMEIFVKPGSYFEMFTTKDWVNVIGADRERCVVTYDRKPEEPNHKTHVIWATSNSVVRNLTLIGCDVKYCIHSDGGKAFRLTIENCVLRREYPPGLRTIRAAYGIGLHANQHILVRDSVLLGDIGLALHNWFDQPASCSLTLERCEVRSKDDAISIHAFGSRQRDFFIAHDSRLQGGHAAVFYRNADKPPPSRWKGQNEIELFGSGNHLDGPILGVTMADDSANRLDGPSRVQLMGMRNPVPASKLAPKSPPSP